LLNALGVRAGTADLAITTENTRGGRQKGLPTVACLAAAPERTRSAGENPFARIGSFNPAMLVHGEQGIELHRPLPTAAEIVATGRVTGIYDKGSGAVVALESTAVDRASGEPLFTTRMSAFIRGEGGFGGDRGPSAANRTPTERPPDHVVVYRTRPDQALIYRLSGDRNPLHSDPAFAAMGGFDRPILHGLCTFGFTGRALLQAVCGNDPDRFVSMDGRFSRPVFPGDELTVSIWVDGDEALFRTERAPGEVVIDAGVCRFTA
ncbi:MAG: MaoC/PaaZ C-terminal domain-containing protein, partial [Acidimicrobiales bacterium]